jgi:hypothetical protein
VAHRAFPCPFRLCSSIIRLGPAPALPYPTTICAAFETPLKQDDKAYQQKLKQEQAELKAAAAKGESLSVLGLGVEGGGCCVGGADDTDGRASSVRGIRMS